MKSDSGRLGKRKEEDHEFWGQRSNQVSFIGQTLKIWVWPVGNSADPEPQCNCSLRPFNKNRIRPDGLVLGYWCWERNLKAKSRIQYFCMCERQADLYTSSSSASQDVQIWAQRMSALMRWDWFSVSSISRLSADCLQRTGRGREERGVGTL